MKAEGGYFIKNIIEKLTSTLTEKSITICSWHLRSTKWFYALAKFSFVKFIHFVINIPLRYQNRVKNAEWSDREGRCKLLGSRQNWVKQDQEALIISLLHLRNAWLHVIIRSTAVFNQYFAWYLLYVASDSICLLQLFLWC